MPEPEDGFFQEAMVVNYPSPDVPFTRIVEYKHVCGPRVRARVRVKVWVKPYPYPYPLPLP